MKIRFALNLRWYLMISLPLINSKGTCGPNQWPFILLRYGPIMCNQQMLSTSLGTLQWYAQGTLNATSNSFMCTSDHGLSYVN